MLWTVSPMLYRVIISNCILWFLSDGHKKNTKLAKPNHFCEDFMWTLFWYFDVPKEIDRCHINNIEHYKNRNNIFIFNWFLPFVLLVLLKSGAGSVSGPQVVLVVPLWKMGWELSCSGPSDGMTRINDIYATNEL